ncbi:MAG: carboxypeptidase Y-deficient [Alyxoria varia]|nr:MAG: carboxypeptidase Y-deficient [Alyxoria varia]
MASTSPRVLGKGRVIGAGKPPPSSNLSPAFPDHVKGIGRPVHSPSDSSISVNSQQSKSSNNDPDISTAVALQSNNAATASVNSRMICPICNEEMVTLLQLNRHLDDAHRNLEDVEQDEVKDWFKSQIVRAKKFQPLAVLNQKFKGLDVFESNEERRPSSHAGITSNSGPSTPEPAVSRVIDPDEYITREHWQRYTPNNACSDPMCGKRLGGVSGNVNCRKCGKLFCEEHTMYQMKLARSAQHEPVRGYWARVCETCYKSREGYNDHCGLQRDRVESFAAIRRRAVDQSYLEVSRLEKRLTKVTQVLTDPRLEQEQGAVAYLKSFSGSKSLQRQLEETVVDWEEDQTVLQCPFCHQEFSTYSFRKHHCRLCGRVVCGDLATGCSTEVGLNVKAPAPDSTEKSAGEVPVNVRMCKDCKQTVFGKADFARQLAHVPPDQRAYQNLKQFERGIRIMLPRFQKLLAALQDPENPPTAAQLAEATKVRKRLTDSFTQYDVAARRIRDLPNPSSSPTQTRLQKQVYLQASQFLHLHMLPLKSIPKILKHAATHGAHRPALPNSHSHGRSASGLSVATTSSSVNTINGNLAPSTLTNGRSPPDDTSSQVSSSQQSDRESRLSSLESEEKAAREQLIVLEEQRFMVSEMLADAQRRRKFEEVASLGKNVDDLTRECDRLQGVLAGLRAEVEGVYVNDDPSGRDFAGSGDGNGKAPAGSKPTFQEPSRF